MGKIAIVGGGMGGLAAAFELVANGHAGGDISVYERDWRLGGKGASGRSLERDRGQRIEEHGLHVLMGFYENVFEILKRCYGDLRQEGKLPFDAGATGEQTPVWWKGVLHGIDAIYFSESPVPGISPEWTHWHIDFPPNADVIGGRARPLPSVKELVVGTFKRFVAIARERKPHEPEVAPDVAKDLEDVDIGSVDHLERRTSTAVRRLDTTGLIQRILERAFDSLKQNTRSHQWFVALYFAGLNLIGVLRDVLPHEATFRDTLDQLDYRDWIESLEFLGLDDRYHRDCAPLNAVYDLVFSRRAGFAAGSALYDTMLMLFHYKGHIYYKMAGGMGDVVFAPLYQWLVERGVTFHFFHDLQSIELSSDKSKIAKLVFEHRGPPATATAYDPILLVDCHDDDGGAVRLPCWRSDPGVPLSDSPETVTVKDFQAVVLAIPVGAIREEVAPGIARCQALYVDPKFAAMAEGMVTQATQAVQLWFDTDLAGLGWSIVPATPAHGPVLGSYQPSFRLNSWADMSQVLPRETWQGVGPRNIAYLCDMYEGTRVPAAANKAVHDDGVAWLSEVAGGLWPNLAKPFPWERLYDPEHRTGPARFEAQYWRANIDGSSQYVTGAPRTSALRLDPHGTQFTNLFLAGDWVKTTLDAGCVEGAALAGRLAARRIFESASKRAASASSYISRDGDLPLLQPVVLGGVSMHGYVLAADKDVLNETLRATFEPLGITCKALLSRVLMTSVQVKEIRSQVRPDDGYMPEAELGFWVPVRMTWSGGSSIGFYVPYLFVDNPAALQAGREIYGFNKILGRFTYGPDNAIDPTGVDAQVLATLSRDSRLDWREIAGLAGTQTLEESPESMTAAAILAAITASLNDDEERDEDEDGFSLPSFPMFFLKQLRGAADGASTDFRRVIKARVNVKDGSAAGGLLRNARAVKLTLPSSATLDIGATLGIASGVEPDIGFWATLTLTVEDGVPIG